jgi:hypothetical protein
MGKVAREMVAPHASFADEVSGQAGLGPRKTRAGRKMMAFTS